MAHSQARAPRLRSRLALLDTTGMGLNWLGGQPPKFHRMRVAERHEAHGLRCPLGDLLDLSTSGLRCRTASKPGVAKGAVVPLVIQNVNQTIRLMGRIVWIRRTSMLSGDWQIGVQFLDVRPGIKAALDQFARYGFIQNLGGAASMSTMSDTPPPAAKPAGSPTSATAAGKPTGDPQPADQQRRQQQNQQQAHAAPDANLQKYATVEIEDLYRHLGLTIDADEAAIHKAYRAVAKQLHPDHNPDPAAQEQFVFINKAYGVLRDANKRARYDAMLRASQRGREQGPPNASNPAA